MQKKVDQHNQQQALSAFERPVCCSKASASRSLLPASKTREPVVSSLSSRTGPVQTFQSFQPPSCLFSQQLVFQRKYGVFTCSDEAGVVWARVSDPQGKAESRSRPGSAAELILLSENPGKLTSSCVLQLSCHLLTKPLSWALDCVRESSICQLMSGIPGLRRLHPGTTPLR